MSDDSAAVALIDIDDILADSVPTYLQHINKEMGQSYRPQDMAIYDFTAGLGIPYELVMRTTANPSVLSELTVMPYALAGLLRLRELGFRLHLLTSRKETVRSVTQAWLDRHGLPYDELIMGQNKGNVARTYRPSFTIAFEDRLDTAIKLAADIDYVFLLNRWWNRKPVPLTNILRFDSWREIGDMLTYTVNSADALHTLLDDNKAALSVLASAVLRRKNQGIASHIWVMGQLPQSADAELLDAISLAQLEPLVQQRYIDLLITTRTDNVLVERLGAVCSLNVLENGTMKIEEITEQIEKPPGGRELILFKLHGGKSDLQMDVVLRELSATGLLLKLLQRESLIFGSALRILPRYLSDVGKPAWYINDFLLAPVEDAILGILQMRGSETNLLSGLYAQPYNFAGLLSAAIEALRSEGAASVSQPDQAASSCIEQVPSRRFNQLIGRQEEFQQIQGLLSSSSKEYAVSIFGIGGIVKTSLALEIAHAYLPLCQLGQLGFDTIIWTPISSKILLDQPSEDSDKTALTVCITTIATALEQTNILRDEREKQVAHIYTILQKRHALLIIDGLEGGRYPMLTEFINNMPRPTKFLITSLEAFSLGYSIKLKPLNEIAAIDLIRRESEYRDVDLDESQVRDLYEYTSGIPLAIVWVIGQLKRHTISKIKLKRLTSRLPEELLLKQIFQTSITILAVQPASIKALCMLSLFTDKVEYKVLRASMGLYCDEDALNDTLDLAADLNLILVQGGKISMLSLAKRFVALYLTENCRQLQDQYQREWIEAISLLALKHAPGYWDFNGYEYLMTYNDDLRSALNWCLSHQLIKDSYILMRAFSFGCIYAGRWNELLEVSGRFSELMAAYKHDHAQAWVKSCVTGWVRTHQNVLSEAEADLQDALALYRTMQDMRGIAQTTRLLGRLRLEQKNYPVALELLEAARNQLKVLDWQTELGFATYDLAWFHTPGPHPNPALDQGKAAKDYFMQAEKLIQGSMEPLIAGLFTTGIQEALAQRAFNEENYAEARDLCGKALTFYQQTPGATHGYRPPRIQLLQARALAKLGNIAEATSVLANAIGSFERLGMAEQVAEAGTLMTSLMKSFTKGSTSDPIRVRNAFALVVGINEYEHLTSLTTSIHDATAVYETLIDPHRLQPFDKTNVTLLLNHEATKGAISSKLECLARLADKEALILIYFTGHGISSKGGFYAGEYLCPVETDASDLKRTAITSAELERALQALRAQYVVLVLDACHAGAFSGGSQYQTGFTTGVYNSLASKGGRVVLASSTAEEDSYEVPNLNHSLFTHHFLEALRGRVAENDALVRIYDITRYVQEHMPRLNARQHAIVVMTSLRENFVVL